MTRGFKLFLCTIGSVAVMSALPHMARADFWADMKAAAKAGINPKVRGRIELRDGAVLTCFEGIKTGYLGPRDLMSPGYVVQDPYTGKMTARTAALPTIIMLKPATVMSNDCDKLAEGGLLTPDGVPTGSGGKLGQLNPNTSCRDVPRAMQTQYPRCISFDPEDHCSALPIDGTWRKGQTDLSAVCNNRRSNDVIEEEARYQAKKKLPVPR